MKWISIKDEFPIVHDHVLLYIPSVEGGYEYTIGYMEYDGSFYFLETEKGIDCLDYNYLISHWMPLPAPPVIYAKLKLTLDEVEKFMRFIKNNNIQG